MSQTISQRLDYLRKANRNRQWINHDLYRLLYKPDLYILAYERIKSKPGNMTPGTDGATLDGFSLDQIDALIQELRTEQFRFQPSRTTFIPKPNGKLRKRDEFLAMLAHELRNPLAPLRNAVYIMQQISLRNPTLEKTRDLIDRQTSHACLKAGA